MIKARYTTDESLRNLLGTEESETLEFKREVWSDGREAAKDVAAMANAWGGEILIGVGEERGESRASEFVMTVEASERERDVGRIRRWLEHHLRPRDFVDRLQFKWLTSPNGNAVLAVRVPAAARACMAVALGDQRKGTRFRFPVRTGQETRDMEYDEVLARMADHGRAIRIQLEGLVPPPPMKARVRIASPIRFVLRGGPYLLRRTEEHGADGEITELRPTSLVVTFRASYHSTASNRVLDDLQGREVDIPYPLVQAVWQHPSGMLQVALDGAIDLWDGRVEVNTR